MTRKEKIFKALSKKHTIDILAHIYKEYPLTFSQLCKDFPELSEHTVRKATNSLSSTGLIESVYLINSEDRRRKGYVIKDVNTVSSLLDI